MKKLFTFFAAMALVTMSFAQLTESTVTNVDNGNLNRSDWFGYTSNSSSAFIFDAEAEYLLRIPAGELTAGTTITKVTFQHLTSENFSGYTGTPFACETYTIKIYTGTTLTPVTYMGSDEQEHTYDSLAPGTIAYSQTYSPTETGIQEVTLTTPFTVPNADFCVAIYAPDKSAGGLCPTDPSSADRSFAYMDDETGWWHYQFGNEVNGYTDKPWFLAVYNDDGVGYQPKSDWHTEMYDPDDAQTYPDEITSLYIDQYVDSLRVYLGAFNMGIDSSYGAYYLNLYVDGTTPLYFWEHESLFEEGVFDSYQPNYGFRFQETICAIADLEAEYGLTFPFDFCFNLEYESAPDYNGYDPNLENNTWCVTYTNEENPGPGVHENADNLNVYPNPACNVINVENVAGAQISIFNIAGQEVLAIEAANANETINVANLTEGVYVVRVVNGNEVATSKVSIVR